MPSTDDFLDYLEISVRGNTEAVRLVASLMKHCRDNKIAIGEPLLSDIEKYKNVVTNLYAAQEKLVTSL